MSDFTRQLGAQPGIQLNPVVDNSDGFAPNTSDQVFAVPMRALRGRIDKAFSVDSTNFKKRLGYGESMRLSALNEAYIHVGEAVQKGAASAVVARLSVAAATLSYMIIANAAAGSGAVLVATVVSGAITSVAVTTGGTNYTGGATIAVGGPGTGAVLTPTILAGVITAVVVTTPGTGYTTAPALTVTPTSVATAFSVATALPGSYQLGLKHLECFNDGVILSYHADAVLNTGGTPVATQLLTLRLIDPVSAEVLYEFNGSLDDTAVDDYQNSLYLPDVVAAQTDALEVTVFEGATIAPNSDAYGRDASGQDKWATSAALIYFAEGGTGYQVADYARAANQLQTTQLDYGYISSGASQASALVSNLSNLAFNVNTCFKFDIPGTLSPAAAAAWLAQLGIVGAKDYYCHAFWTPIKCTDPLGINGKIVLGSATFNIAKCCLRNAGVDANGFAPKNYPVAGMNWPLDRTGMTQIYMPSDPELSDLANAKINPVINEVYNEGSFYVFTDSLTCANTNVSLRKLISVADMSSSIDTNVARAGKKFIQLPMAVSIKKMNDYLKKTFEDAQTAGWIIPSDFMGGVAFQYNVVRSTVRPNDQMIVQYSLHYDGVNRQTFITQTISR